MSNPFITTMFSILAIIVLPNVMAFPWVADMPGVRSVPEVEKRQTTCPFNTNHQPAAPITQQFPYAGAINGLPSTRPGNFQVPAPGDTAHAFIPPGPNDIRGPCPGLNSAANHNVGLFNANIIFINTFSSSVAMASPIIRPSSTHNKTFIMLVMILQSYWQSLALVWTVIQSLKKCPLAVMPPVAPLQPVDF